MKKRPIWQKFYFCSLVCVLSAVCVITIVYLTQFWIEKKAIANENIENVTYFADNEIKSKFESVRNLFGSMTVARNLKAAIESGDKSRDNTLQTLSTLYADNNSNNNNVLSIFFLDKNGEHYSVGETLGGLDKRFKIIETAKQSDSFNKNNYVWFHSKTEKGNNICVLYQKIIFLNDALAKEYLGEILVCVDTAKATDNYFKGIANDTGIIFLDEYGTIAASSVSECIGKKFNEAFVEDGNYMSDMLGIRYSLKRSQATIKSWECISFVNYDLLKSKTKNMVFLVICIAIMCCALMGFIAYKITYGIGKPIGELIDYIKVSDDGEVLFETDELLTVKNIFDNIQKKLNAETEIRIFKEEQLRLAQVKAFEEQVNPHFLYNTLQIIQMLSVMGQNDDVQRVITYLGKMLRYGLDSRSEICLGEEIENIETYFKILKYRYTK